MLYNFTIKPHFSVLKAFYNILGIFLIVFLTSCSLPKLPERQKVNKDVPVNAKERARKNIEEGRGISLNKAFKRSGSTNYEFSSSNPLWRASLELIDFMPMTTVDYSGGIIISDWYSDSNNSDESIKITVRFLSSEIRSDSIKIIVHNKKCQISQNCSINEIDSKIKFELQKSILAKAAQYELDSKKSKK